jgi:hypothetical protein
MSPPLLATPANMRKLADGPVVVRGAQLFAYSPRTFERFCATPGDYFWLPDNEPLTDSAGEPMVLAYSTESVVIVDG